MHSEEQFGHVFIAVHFEISYPGCFEVQICELFKYIVVWCLAYCSPMKAHGTRYITQRKCFAA